MYQKREKTQVRRDVGKTFSLSIQKVVKTFISFRDVLFQRQVLEELIFFFLIVIFVLSYLESLRWPLPGPKATHGIVKGLFLVLATLLVVTRKKLKEQKNIRQNLLMTFFVFTYVISAALSFALDAAALHLWYPMIACCVLFALSKISLPKSYQPLLVSISAILVFLTFSFSFFSLMFRYSVDNVYYFIFLDHRANHLLGELRQFGKYVSLGPYLMLAPLTYIFFIQKKATFSRKLLSVFMIFITLLTAVISNNRIDILVFSIQITVLIWLIPRRLAILVLAAIIPVVFFGLMVTEKYFGFNLEERILRPKIQRDIETIDIRFTYWQTALYNFKNAPLFGTGPNSYNDVSIFPIRRYYDQNARNYLWKLDRGIGVHNIFIERLSDTGILGLTAFLLLLFYFLRKDALYFLSTHSIEEKKTYLLFSLGSWSWILYGITDNGYGAQGYMTFFFLRGVINHL
jgi:hypothetical protein